MSPSVPPSRRASSATRPGDFRELLRAGRWFRGLPEGFQAALLDAGQLRQLSAGTRLFARGDEPCGLYGVLDGAVRISGTAASGKEALLVLAEPPTWFGEISILDGLPRTHDAVAETATRLLHVPQAAVTQILEREPSYWRGLGQLVASKLRLTFLALEDVALLPPAPRLARRLVLMTEGYGDYDDRSRRVVEVRQEQLALMLNLSRQTTNQLLKDLEARGLVRLAYGEVEIVDLEGLRAAAQHG